MIFRKLNSRSCCYTGDSSTYFKEVWERFLKIPTKNGCAGQHPGPAHGALLPPLGERTLAPPHVEQADKNPSSPSASSCPEDHVIETSALVPHPAGSCHGNHLWTTAKDPFFHPSTHSSLLRWQGRKSSQDCPTGGPKVTLWDLFPTCGDSCQHPSPRGALELSGQCGSILPYWEKPNSRKSPNFWPSHHLLEYTSSSAVSTLKLSKAEFPPSRDQPSPTVLRTTPLSIRKQTIPDTLKRDRGNPEPALSNDSLEAGTVAGRALGVALQRAPQILQLPTQPRH